MVETPASQKNIPSDWTKNGSTKVISSSLSFGIYEPFHQAKARWLVGSLQKRVRALKEERERRVTAVKSFRSTLYTEFDADRAVWLRAVRVLSELDCLFSLAKASIALGEPSCRPEFADGDSAWVDFEKLRHPTLSLKATEKTFVPNDVKLGGDVGKIALLTGMRSVYSS
jgi:DNA mismatch repair protein MSH6